MKLLFTYEQGMGWIEAPAIYPKRAYVYWLEEKLEELEEIENKANLRKVPIDTNPFKKGS